MKKIDKITLAELKKDSARFGLTQEEIKAQINKLNKLAEKWLKEKV